MSEQVPVSPGAVIGGAVTAVLTAAIGVVVALGLDALLDLTKDGRGAVVSIFAIAGFVLGGFRAGLLAPPAPLANGAAAAAVGYVPMAIVRVVQRLADDRSVPVVGIVFAGLLAACLGVLGGMVSNTANRMRKLG